MSGRAQLLHMGDPLLHEFLGPYVVTYEDVVAFDEFQSLLAVLFRLVDGVADTHETYGSRCASQEFSVLLIHIGVIDD